ncbi:tRNA pseudouridine(55) synthase TruB [Clostridiaceae bacterium M8S5]|nr:tRNA pseudouridine(55) synthase TruB [Clostridiaceae bacterium M8S5]
MDGILNVFKPTGMTSHDVVSFIRRVAHQKKVGHTGTLDPNAVGVLPICLGRATKVAQFLSDDKKSYRCEVVLGKQTDTQDRYGKVINISDKTVTVEEFAGAINSFIGQIKQIPPMYSALKKDGKKLYELAREGKRVDVQARDIYIYKIEIIHINNTKAIFDVECSKGTYVRTLCNDIGEKLGTYGYMNFLLRSKVGVFKHCTAKTLEEIEQIANNGELESLLKPIDYVLYTTPKLYIHDKYFTNIINGVKIRIYDKKYSEDILYRVYCKGTFIGIGKINLKDNIRKLKMQKVFIKR